MGCSCSNAKGLYDEALPLIPCEDYSELPHQMTGAGIKETRAWTGTITRSELRGVRNRFWATTYTGHMFVWMQIKQAVEADPQDTSLILQQAGIRTVNGSMQICLDFEGTRYHIPIFVLNDPEEFVESEAEAVDESHVIQICLREPKSADLQVCIPTGVTVRHLKKELSIPDCRLFFSGRELQDYRKVSDYKLEEGMTVLVFNPKTVH